MVATDPASSTIPSPTLRENFWNASTLEAIAAFADDAAFPIDDTASNAVRRCATEAGRMDCKGACRKRERAGVHGSLAITHPACRLPGSRPMAPGSRRLQGPPLRGHADRAGGILVSPVRPELPRHRGDAPGARPCLPPPPSTA